MGFCSWFSQESLSLALGSVKSGTTAAFQNLALVIAFLTDVLHFKRVMFFTDIMGALLIIIFTCAQSIISNRDNGEASDL